MGRGWEIQYMPPVSPPYTYRHRHTQRCNSETIVISLKLVSQKYSFITFFKVWLSFFVSESVCYMEGWWSKRPATRCGLELQMRELSAVQLLYGLDTRPQRGVRRCLPLNNSGLLKRGGQRVSQRSGFKGGNY